MKTEWYYADKGHSIGPISFEDVAARIRRAINLPHIVWTEGMEDWCDAKDVAAFSTLFRSSPPPLPYAIPPAGTNGRGSKPVATSHVRADYAGRSASPMGNCHAWRRYFARIFDGFLFTLCGSVAVGIMFPSALDSIGNEQVLNLVILFVYIPVEGFILYAFGTSTGKALYGISINREGGEVTWFDATKRAALVWFRGIGLGIPIVALFTLGNAYGVLKNKGATSWDSQLGWTVSHSELGVMRWLGIMCAWIAMLGIFVTLMALGAK
jgi:hypothetical protein